jgi:hypothetical protein
MVIVRHIGWQVLLGEHLKRFVEQHKGYREV